MSWHQEEGGPWLGEGCSLEELWSLELQAGFSENHLFDYLSTPSFLHPSTLLTSSSFSEHPFGSCHSVHDATREQSLSSSSSGSVHSAATYRHNLKELQSRLKQRYAGDSDKESAEMSEEKRKEDEEVAMVHQALQQLACVNIHDVCLYLCVRMCMFVFPDVYVCVLICVCVHTCGCVCMCACVLVHITTYTRAS